MMSEAVASHFAILFEEFHSSRRHITMTIHRKIKAKRKKVHRCTCGEVILHIQTIKNSEVPTDLCPARQASRRGQKCGPLGNLISRSYINARDHLVVPFSSGKAKITRGKATAEDKCMNCVRKTRRHEKQQKEHLLETISILQRIQIVKSESSRRSTRASPMPREVSRNGNQSKPFPGQHSKQTPYPQFSSCSQKTPTRFTFESFPSSYSRDDIMMDDPVGVDSADILKDLARPTENDSDDILKDLAEFSVLVASREKPGSASSCVTAKTAASYASSECNFFSTDRKKNQAPISCKMATMESVELSVSDFHKMDTSDT
jgi:hypothetical protein